MKNFDNFGQADIFLQKAIEVNPEFTDSYILRAQVCMQLKMDEIALKCALDGLSIIKINDSKEKRDMLNSTVITLVPRILGKPLNEL